MAYTFFDPKSGAVVPLATVQGNPSAYAYFDPKSGRVLSASTAIASPAGLGYFDPTSGAVLPASGVLTPTPPASVQRAGATNTDLMSTNAFAAAGSYSYVSRQIHTRPYDINVGDLIEFAVPWWQVPSTGVITETDYAEPMAFQGALEYPYTMALTGLSTANRYALTDVDSGTNTMTYTPGLSARSFGIFRLVSPVYIPANTPFGGWLSHEFTASTTLGKKYCRFTVTDSVMGRFEGGNDLSVSAVAANSVMTRTSVSSVTTALQPNLGFAGIRFPHTLSQATGVGFGNSLEEGGGLEGIGSTDVTGGYGGLGGDNLGCRSYTMRYARKLGVGFTQVSKGSDCDIYRNLSKFTGTISGNTLTVSRMYQGYLLVGDIINTPGGTRTITVGTAGGAGTYTIDGAAQTVSTAVVMSGVTNHMKRRADFINWCNPTFVSGMNATNEFTKTMLSGALAWTAGMTVVQDMAVYSNGYLYLANADGVAGSTAPSGTGLGVSDGTITWDCFSPDDLGASARTAAGVIGGRRWMLRNLRSICPNGFKYVEATTTPIITPQVITATTTQASDYNSTTGVFTFNGLTDTSWAFVGNQLAWTGITGTGFTSANTGNPRKVITAVTSSTVSVQLATGLGTPSGTATLNPGAPTLGSQIAGVVGTSGRSFTNRFARQVDAGVGAPYNNVCNVSALADLGRWMEYGNPLLVADETGKFIIYNDTGTNISYAANADGTHGVSRSYDTVAAAVAAVAGFKAKLTLSA